MNEKYSSEDPLPGGVDKYYETLMKLLECVGEKVVPYDDLVNCVTGYYPQAKGTTAMSVYLGGVSRMGLWQIKDKQVRLTPEGTNLLVQGATDSSAGKHTVLEIKRQKVAGYDEILSMLCAGGRSLEELDTKLQEAIDTDWKTKNQTSFRLSWLRSLGFLERQGFEYHLTPAGSAIAKEVLAGHIASPKPPVKTPAPPKQLTAIMQMAMDIADRIDQAAVKGLDGVDLEQITAEAFAFLGFDSKVISGPGNPDVVVTAPMGEAGYRVLIDTKSRASGCVQQGDVSFDALQQHKAKFGADYTVVLGRDFAGGNLETWAKDKSVRLLRTEELRQVLIAYAEGVVSLDCLESLFRGGGSLDEATLTENLAESEHITKAMLLTRLVYDAVCSHQDEEGALNADSLFYVLGKQYSIQEIQVAVDWLQSDLISALAKTENGSLFTRLTPRMLADKLTQLQRVGGENFNVKP